MFPGTMKEVQNVTTYTIGFTIDSPLLRRTAENSGGKYFFCHNSQSFIAALQSIINDILSKSTSFVAPVVPISQMERTSAGDRLYLAMFKPTAKSFWKGNIKKYGIATTTSGTIQTGMILDANGKLAVDEDGQIKNGEKGEKAQSYWSSAPDGDDVEAGGVGEKLRNRSTPRNIYTYLGTSTNLVDPSNRFTLENASITPQTLNLSINDTNGREKIINFIHGLDSYDENGNGNLGEKRDWILGAFIHSRPYIVHYGSSRSVIYAGANDGMLHAFDDTTGEELWAFIPPNLLPKLKNLEGESLEFFVDGAPKAYIDPNTNQVILIIGQRRGGNCYHALDVSDPLAPKLLWEISPSREGFQELGQTWSTPQLGKIAQGSTDKMVVFFGGGYDTNQDDLPVTRNDSRGRAVYVVDLFTGSLIWSYSYANNASMNYCISSDVARVDTNDDGRIDRLYAATLGGRIWRFDLTNTNPANWTAKPLFNANPGGSEQRKIFYPPDVTLERDNVGNYEMLFFGTGDREHPKDITVLNRIYAVKDRNPSSLLSESDLVDVTQDQLQDPGTTADQKEALLNALAEKSGWYIKLDINVGEKVLASPVVFFKKVYYSTFSPSIQTEPDPCFIGQGRGRIYILQYMNGNAAFNLDASNDIGGEVIQRSDRTGVIGAAMPSGVIITFIGGKAVAYVGIGGGVYTPQLATTKSLVPINWRLVF
jgi:type IV pilus assembly protein PilY1